MPRPAIPVSSPAPSQNVSGGKAYPIAYVEVGHSRADSDDNTSPVGAQDLSVFSETTATADALDIVWVEAHIASLNNHLVDPRDVGGMVQDDLPWGAVQRRQ